jgi:hypothetical protein
MPYVEGESLRDPLNRERQLPLDDALQIVREVADALSHAHRPGIVHRAGKQFTLGAPGEMRARSSRPESLGRIELRNDRTAVLAVSSAPSPIPDLDASEASEVFGIRGDQHEAVDVGGCGDLPVDVGRRPAKPLQARTLAAVPRGGRFIVRQNGK